MKLIPWQNNQYFEAYTTTRELGDISLKNNPAEALKARQDLADLLACDLNKMVAPHQTHTANFTQVFLKDGGSNIIKLEDKFNNIDATYTRDKGLTLFTFHADCTPILLYSPDQNLVCAIHSGWPGTVKQIVTKVVKHLISQEGCNPQNMQAYIGPCISYSYFEVQIDVIKKVQAMDFDTRPFYHQIDETHYLMDNKGLNKQQLLNQGLRETNITVSPYCTVINNDLFFSHRKNKDGKRNISLIRLKDNLK